MGRYDKNFEMSMNGYMNLNDSAEENSGGGGEGPEDYYKASAILSHYKGVLNEKLKQKNPEAFKDYFKNLVDLRRSGKTKESQKYVQEAAYNEYLSPEEIKKTLGDTDYQKYLDSLKAVNSYNVQQGQQPLYGNVEGENDITKLNYGRRFASLQITPSISVYNQTSGKNYNRNYQYNPVTGSIDFQETGDINLRPSYLSSK